MTRRPPPQPGIAARYECECPRCGEVIHVGDRIAHRRGHYIHTRCCSGGDDE